MFAHLRSTVRRLSGLAALMLLLAGIPYALVHYLGTAVPHRLPTLDQVTAALSAPLTDEVLGGLLVAVLWLAWAAFVWSVIVEVAAVVAGIRLPQPKAFAPARGLAAVLVATIAGGVLATAAAQAAPPTAAQAAPVNRAAATATVAAKPATLAVQRHDVAAAKTGAGHVTLLAAGKHYTYTVQPGDSLSEIAKAWLGDANRWPEIFALNRGHHMSTGTLKDPKIIRAGWTLELPDDATPPSGAIAKPADTPPPVTGTEPSHPQQSTPASPAQTTPAGHGGTSAQTPETDDGVTDDHADNNKAPDKQQAPAPAITGVELPSGSWVDVGLVAALIGAVALVFAHRQRRYRRGPNSTGRHLDDPMPQVVRHVRRGLRGHAATGLDRRSRLQLNGYPEFFTSLRAGDTTPPAPEHPGADSIAYPQSCPSGTAGDPAAWQPYSTAAGAFTDRGHDAHAGLLDAGYEHDGRHRAAERDAEDGFADELGPFDVHEMLADAPPPVTPALANPIAAAWPAAGIGLTGPGADAAARGFLVAALAAGATGDLDARSTVVIPAATLATLLGADAIIMPKTPRLTVTAGLSEALELIEEQTLHRSRLLYEYEVEDATALREADPMAEPITPLMLIADVTAEHERARIAALLTQSQRLDIHGVLLGAWPHGDTVDVGIDGSTLPAGEPGRRRRHLADLGRLTVLTFAEASDLLHLLAESHTGEPQPAPPAEPGPSIADPLLPLAGSAPDDEKADLLLYAELQTRTPADPDADHEPAAGAETAPAAGDFPADSDQPLSTDADSVPPTPATAVLVQAFGKPRIIDAPADERVRPQAVELLIYLAARGGAASQDDILEDLLPEVSAKTAPHRLHTFTSNLRRIAGLIAGGGTFLTVERKQYRLNRAAFDIDLWRLHDAVTEAAATTDRDLQVAALRRGLAAYTAPLADTSRGYDWAEPYREAVRRKALDAALTLADLLDDDREALDVLDTAITQHPHAEQLYQAAMRRHAARGDLDAVKQVHRALTQCLEELDAEPGDDTMELFDELMAQARRHARQSGADTGRRA